MTGHDATAAGGAAERPAASPFASFWMGGYEGADHVNGERRPLDIARESGHLDRLEADHRAAAEQGLRTIRESVGWRLGEPAPGRYDLARATRIARSAAAHGLQVVWSLMHYGTPDDLSLLDDRMIDRFARFAAAAADRLAPYADRPTVWNPVNEISFVAWAVSTSNLMYPYRGDGAAGGQADPALGYAVKKRLIRATLAAIDAIRSVDPRARFLHVDPMVHVAAPPARPDRADAARTIAAWQWQTWDMVAGRVEPELGGHPAALDLIGINHYHSSQWETPGDARLDWHARDPRRRPVGALLHDCWARYGRPIVLAETSHFGDGRATWLHQIAGEVREARAAGVPVEGICLYPLVDRPDWTDPDFWHHSGLWDVAGARQTRLGEVDVDAPFAADAALSSGVDPAAPPDLRRVLAVDYAEALRSWRAALPAPPVADDGEPPPLLMFSPWRWDGLHHRPQQWTMRLAARRRVVFVEEPVALDAALVPYLDRAHRGPRIEVWVPRLPGPAHGFDPAARARIAPLLTKALRDHGVAAPIVWCATPLALPLADAVADRRGLVCDVVVDLAAFDGASPELGPLEDRLLAEADLVFCAGPMLAADRRGRRPDLQVLPNAVDPAAWAAPIDPAGHQARTVTRLHRGIGRPRLGYAGAIDERLDLALIDAVARARPDWHWVLAGPVCKIDPATLPDRPNVHLLPLQPAARLRALYADWDVGVLPFLTTEATRSANPVKLLEYRAAGLPVVATPLADVVALHRGAVRTAADAAGFVAACAAALDGSASGEADVGAAGAPPTSGGHRPPAPPIGPTWDAGVAAIEAALAGLSAARRGR